MLFRRKTTSHSSLGKPWGTSKALSNEIQLLLTSSRHSGKNEHRSINHILVTLFFSKGTSLSFKKEQKLLSSQGTSTSTLCFPSPSSTRSSSWWELMSKMKFSLSTCLRIESHFAFITVASLPNSAKENSDKKTALFAFLHIF